MRGAVAAPAGAPEPVGAAGEAPGTGAAPEPLPDTMDYDPATRRLKIGKGYVENVTPEMWAYEVYGMNVLRAVIAEKTS